MNKLFILLTLILGLAINAKAFALEDMPSSADHPKLNRIAGTNIVAYSKTDYGDHEFLTAYENKNVVKATKEGKLTRLVYALKEGQTALFALRNYQEAFTELGEVKELFSCVNKECPRELGNEHIWGKDKRFKSSVKTLNKMYAISSYHNGSRYWLGEIESDTTKYTVSFYAASAAHRSVNERKLAAAEGLYVGQTFIHLNIVEKSTFKSDLSIVEASEIQQSISKKGHVALYGLFFDTGKDQLTNKSKPALIEIAKALKSDDKLNVYVVGHTDNIGSRQSNQLLSEQRAASIIESLTTEFDIQAPRLIPIGVGLAAPVATNDTEDGRSLNRRVELVKR